MIEKILIAGKMGLWLVETLCLDYRAGVYDTNADRLRLNIGTAN